jgi:hypothetical protein
MRALALLIAAGTILGVPILADRDGRFVVSNLLFEPGGYYYAGPIVNLMKFLGAYKLLRPTAP